MKSKYLFVVIFLTLAIILPQFSYAATSVATNSLSVVQTYPYQFDVLVADVTVNLDSNDFLKTFTVQNIGTARTDREIKSVHLWLDGGTTGFQGLGIDSNLGTGVFDNNLWVWNNLNLDVYSGANRFFVTIETIDQRLTDERNIQFQIPSFYDVNHNFVYESGDAGLFFNSQLTLPIETLNSDRMSLKTSDIDNYSPKIVITSNAEFDSMNFMVGGVYRDQGKAGMDYIKASIVPADTAVKTWQDAVLVPNNNNSWFYGAAGLMIGYYDLYVKGADTSGNITELAPQRIFVDNKLVEDIIIDTTVPAVEVTIVPVVTAISRDLTAEAAALSDFVKIKGYLPSTSADWQILRYLVYGMKVPSTVRNLSWEVNALGEFGKMYGEMPKTAYDWNVIKVLSYSGVPTVEVGK